ncbi:MAG: helix-turn-helix domain-containing protein [Arcobacter sp.]
MKINSQEEHMDFSEKFSIIQKELKLSQKDFAAKIELSPNAISQYLTGKRKPDIHTIQKLIDIGVSPLFLFADAQTPFDATYDKFVEARLKYGDEELTEIIENYLLSKNILTTIKEKIERLKGQTFFEKLSNIMSGDGERMLVLLYSFFLHLEKSDIKISTENLNLKFYELLENYEFNPKETLKFGVLVRRTDLDKLITWAKSDLDSVSIIEIISSLPELKKYVKDQLYKIDSYAIGIVEKYFL